MKKTQVIEAVRNIRRNRVSFLSVIIISMLAAVAFLGIDFSAEGLKRSADATYSAGQAADVEIYASSLMAETDLESIRAAEGVSDAEGIMYVPSRVTRDSRVLDIVIRSVPERISLPHVLDGRLPGAADECAVEKTLADKMGYRVGDRVQLAARSSTTDILIKTRTYTVTGTFTIADHLTEMVSFEPVLLVTRDAFNTALVPKTRYTRVLARIDAADPYRFSPAWTKSVEEAARRLETINDRWIVTALHNTASYISTDKNAGMLFTVAATFSLLFVLIAALVIYSTVCRLITSDSRLVGAEKAMGLKNGEIFAKYLLFGLGGTVIGVAAGILIAYFIFERIVLYFFGTVFLLSEQRTAFLPVPALIILGGSVMLGTAAVFAACRHLLKSTAVTLMKGQDAGRCRRGKASLGSLPLYIRLMLRNMRSDLKRARVPDKQYNGIQRFSMEIVLDPSAGRESVDSIRAVLDQEGLPHACIYTAEMPYKAGDEAGMLTLICPDEGQDLSGYYCFPDEQTGAARDVPESGMLVSRRFAEQYSLKPGDPFLLYGGGTEPHAVEVAGIFENYIGIIAVCDKAYAESCLGEALSANTLLLLRNPENPDALLEKLAGAEGFLSMISSRKQEALFNGLSSMLNLVILLLGVLAVMIACFILLNLVSTYVNQKKNELSIMRINGYSTRETILYASMECYGITLLGILLGLAGGHFFSSFLIGLVEQLSMGFVKEPLWITFAGSAVITAVISAAVHFFAFRQIRSLKLSDIQQ